MHLTAFFLQKHLADIQRIVTFADKTKKYEISLINI